MPLSYAELEQFYEGLVARARRRGIVCAITSGMACVAYGVAQARPYMLAVKRDRRSNDPALHTQHLARVEYAERLLPVNPLRQYGLERLVAEAQAQAARFVLPGALAWLPDVRGCFIGLSE